MAVACSVPYPDATFEYLDSHRMTMFVLVTKTSIRASIAREMARVTKPANFLLNVDWRYGGAGIGRDAAMSTLAISRL